MALVVCFNMIIAPTIILILLLYFINNKNRALTYTEQAIIFVFVFPFMLYTMIARIYGLTIGFSVAIPSLIIGLLILIYKKRGGIGI